MLTSVGAVKTENVHDLSTLSLPMTYRNALIVRSGFPALLWRLNNDSWDGIPSTSLTIPRCRPAGFPGKNRSQEGHSRVPAIRLSVLVAHPRGPEMRELVRRPYCVLDLEFRPMIAHLDGRYICGSCGHTAYPADMRYHCRCFKGLELGVAQIAS